MTQKFKVGQKVYWLAKGIDDEYDGAFPFCERKISEVLKNGVYFLSGFGWNFFYENELFTEEEVKKKFNEWIDANS